MHNVFRLAPLRGAILAASLAVMAPAWSANLLVNPSLETDTSPVDSWPDGNWKLQNASPTTAEKAQWVSESASGIDSNHSSGGNRGIRVKSNYTWNGSSAVLTQEKNLTYDVTSLVSANGYDKDYDFSVWLRGTLGGTVQTDSSGTQTFKNGTTYVVLSYNLGSSTTTTLAPAVVANAGTGVKNLGWQNIGSTVTIPSGATGIQIKFGLVGNSQGEVYLDDVVFQPTPAPSGVTFKNGQLKIDGQPFFINGFFMGKDVCRDQYGVIKNNSGGACDTGSGYVWDVQRIKDAGYNTVLSYPTGNNTSLALQEAFVDRAASYGLKVIISLKDFVAAGTPTNDPTLLAFVDAMKVKSNVIGWYTCDELNQTSVGTGSAFEQYYDMIKARDTMDRPVIALLTHVTPVVTNPTPITNDPAAYLPNCDVIMADPYPVGSKDRGRGDSIAMAFRWAKMLRDDVSAYNLNMSADNKRAAWLAPQAFAWGGAPFSGPSEDEAPPTLREVRNMAYQAIAGGASSIMFWSYEEIAGEYQWQYGSQDQVLRDSVNLAKIAGYDCWETYINSPGNPTNTSTNKMKKILRTGNTSIDPDNGATVPQFNLGRRMGDMTTVAGEVNSLKSILDGISSEEGIQELGPSSKVKARLVTSGGDLYVFVTNAHNIASGAVTITLPSPVLTSPARTVSVVKQDVNWAGTPLTSGQTGFISPVLAADKLSVSVSNINPWGSFVLKVSPR